MRKQLTFIERADEEAKKYTTAAGSPLYVPKDRRPHIFELHDPSRQLALMREIEEAEVTDHEKRFLFAAAHRHTVFNYELIADYYAHASPEMQRLMEASALVIVDVDEAVERGYVRLCEKFDALFREEVASEGGA